MVLRLGLFEATRLGVPPPVAVDAAVRLVRTLGIGSASGMVNAVLRRATAGFEERLRKAPEATRLAFPAWLAARWQSSLGEVSARVSMEAALEPAPVWVWFLDDADRVAAASGGLELHRHPWCPDAWSSAECIGDLLDLVRSGKAYVQDPASQLVSEVATGLLSADPGQVVDLCAAPGGKAARILRARPDIDLVTLDRHPGRVRLLRGLIDRVVHVGRTTVAVADAAAPPLTSAGSDLVLLDAPCSGTGTLRRHPEIKWRLDVAAIEQLATLQRRLIVSAIDLVAPGGVLLYTTCSIEPEENEAHFAELPDGFETIDLRPLLPPGTPSLPAGRSGLRLPPSLESDGFTLHAARRATSSIEGGSMSALASHSIPQLRTPPYPENQG
jgi:16S rRNA (cytosine967-C5)-methyltransferase